MHRVQRVPVTEASGRIHTSTATVAVLPKAEEVDIHVSPEDIKVDVFHSGGAGGQNVNKVSTCVVLRHGPTGLEVRCQRERSQALNRFLARRILVDKIETARLGEQSEKRRQIEKIRRQKRKRSKRAKEKMLEAKRLRSLRKESRAKIKDFAD